MFKNLLDENYNATVYEITMQESLSNEDSKFLKPAINPASILGPKKVVQSIKYI